MLNNRSSKMRKKISSVKTASYEVSIGNIGNIPCDTLEEAREIFSDYVEQSASGRGRAAGEDVVLFEDDEIIDEYFGDLSEAETDTYSSLKSKSGIEKTSDLEEDLKDKEEALELKQSELSDLEIAIETKQSEIDSWGVDIDEYEEQYNESLDELGDLTIGHLSYSPSHVLREIDPTAYRAGLIDYVDSLELTPEELESELEELEEYAETLREEISDIEMEIEDIESDMEDEE